MLDPIEGSFAEIAESPRKANMNAEVYSKPIHNVKESTFGEALLKTLHKRYDFPKIMLNSPSFDSIDVVGPTEPAASP